MPCSVCSSPEAKYRCIDCAAEVCREHAVGCEGCRKPLCQRHAQKTPGGRTLCKTCMAERTERQRLRREAREGTPKPVAPPQNAGFSFQDLMSDLPPMPSGGSTGFADLQADAPPATPAGLRDFDDPRDERNANALGLDEVPDPDIERKLAQMLGEDNQAVRVLNASAPKSNPMWYGSTFLGLVTWAAFWFISPAFDFSRYVVLILALGASAWAISGLRNENEAPGQRKLNAIGLLLAVLAAIVAFLPRG